MSQPLLQRIALDVSRKTGDPVSPYTADGKVFKASQRETAIYEAINKLYEDRMLSLGIDRFDSIYSEFRKVFPAITITGGAPSSRAVPKDSSIKKIISIHVDTTMDRDLTINTKADRLTLERYYDALYNPYSNWKPTNERPYFFEEDTQFSIEVLNQALLSTAILKLLVVSKPVFTAFDVNGDDVVIPEMWIPDAANMAAAFLLQNQQIV